MLKNFKKKIREVSLKQKNKIFNKKGSQYFWDNRYREGHDSGAGSYNRLAQFKANVVNEFICKENIESVIEWGCGDGNQLSLINYKTYVGVDVSPTVVKMCKVEFSQDKSKRFFITSRLPKNIINGSNKFDMSVSLDVIFHLTEDDVFEKYMNNLFDSSKKFVCIYSSNLDSKQIMHVKHRKFTDYIDSNFTNWDLYKKIKNKYPYRNNRPNTTSFCDFYFYRKV